MFIIVPKKRAGKPTNHSDIKALPSTTSKDPNHETTDSRGPVRTIAACDPCRVAKVKCNGQEPCGRCSRREQICVYSRPLRKDVPATSPQIALLQHQQHRMSAAIQQMAAVIARLADGAVRAPQSFNVPQLLDQYAPDHHVHDLPTGGEGPVWAGVKRGCPDPITAESATMSTRRRFGDPESWDAMRGNVPQSVKKTHMSLDPPSDVSVSNENTEASTQYPDQVMDFLRAMCNASPRRTTDLQHQTIVERSQTSMNGSHAPSIQGEPAQMALASPSLPQNFFDLVDWDASMQLFQDSYSLSQPDGGYAEGTYIDRLAQCITDVPRRDGNETTRRENVFGGDEEIHERD